MIRARLKARSGMPNQGKSKTLLLELLFTCRVAVRFTTTPQVNQLVLRLPKAGEPNDPADFKEKPPVDVKDTKDYLSQMIFRIENATWRGLSVLFTASTTRNSIPIQRQDQSPCLLLRLVLPYSDHGTLGR